jgi:glycerol uptake facilitator-like aquaporin
MPDEKNLLLGLFMETFAVMIIHIVRISLLIDNRGNKESNGVAIGAAYTMFVMASAEISGACFNPARALGPFFFMDGVGASSQLLMAICPFVGCTLAMALYKQFLMSESLEEELDEL